MGKGIFSFTLFFLALPLFLYAQDLSLSTDDLRMELRPDGVTTSLYAVSRTSLRC